ncbi:Hypothetical protein EUBREC_1541 [Agathobacter rectalis ATCC 33656]|uniref:Uncharacterized protein n=1 Tax=Agathobacter rectalis (strain ATCC 33656 / DSM 3377 / JCM 17463 / KCTC 5835 / VPI 0990) TaxID=515619 RepID=C4Z972_AGARV|nr:Hypothetical protein EUBREC_1541 [Agathobacter rectalis ATCC 33656]
MIKPPFFLAKPHLFLVLLSMPVYRLEHVVGLPAAGGHDIAVCSDFMQQKVRLINHLRSQ